MLRCRLQLLVVLISLQGRTRIKSGIVVKINTRKNTTQESSLEKRKLRKGDHVIVKTNPPKVNTRKSSIAFQLSMSKWYGGMTGIIKSIDESYAESDCRVDFEDGSFGFFYRENLELDPRYLTKLGSLM